MKRQSQEHSTAITPRRLGRAWSYLSGIAVAAALAIASVPAYAIPDRAAPDANAQPAAIGQVQVPKGQDGCLLCHKYPGLGRYDKDARNRIVHTANGSTEKGDVINIIPPQAAGKIAKDSGLTNESGWCPVNGKTMESSIAKGVHVIGDASIAGAMPKSAYAANSQAKVAAGAVVAMLGGKEPGVPSYLNTCYSIPAHNWGISVAGVYKVGEDGKIGHTIKDRRKVATRS